MPLSDSGFQHLQSILDAVDRLDLANGLADYSDYGATVREVIAQYFDAGLQPDTADEFLEDVRARVEKQIHDYAFVVPINGVKLEADLEAVPLGSFRIVRASIEVLEGAGIDFKEEYLRTAVEMISGRPWLMGRARGTLEVATRRFREMAELTVGMLSVYAASVLEGGTRSFRLGIVMSPLEAEGRSLWLSWSDGSSGLRITESGTGKQKLEIDQERSAHLHDWPPMRRGFELVANLERNHLEECIARALYWFADAQRDSVPVMQFVKLWSCAECFFAADNEQISENAATGLATVLKFGDYEFRDDLDYAQVKKRIKHLYDMRSRAVHGAQHVHVSTRDTSDLSQWVAWMLFNVLGLLERGFTSPRQLRDSCMLLGRQIDTKASV